MQIKVSVDKVVIEFCNVKQSDFINFYASLRMDSINNLYKSNEPNGYLYTFSIHQGEECMFFSYLNYKEREHIAGTPHLPMYTLRVETALTNLIKHKDIVDGLKGICSRINFVSADVAYDVPVSLESIFVMSNDNRRKIYTPLDFSTRYFGVGTQRKQNGYCRIYDKAAQLREQKQVEIDGELSRIEIVYKPGLRIVYSEITNNPPRQNKEYFAKIIDDLSWCNEKRRTEIINTQLGKEGYSQYLRREIKKSLSNQMNIDFDCLASSEWANIMNASVESLKNNIA